jgi:hypothetical protein
MESLRSAFLYELKRLNTFIFVGAGGSRPRKICAMDFP